MNSPLRRRHLFALLAGCAASNIAAQSKRPPRLRLIVPAPAGGTTDTVARALVEALRRTAGLTAIVDNRPGVGGAIAMDALLAAPHDGWTLLVSPNSIVTELPYTIHPRYDPFQDLVPLVELASIGLVLVANPKVPVQTVPDMVSYVKARPGKLAYASYGAGTLSHIKALQFCQANGLDMLHVGYKGSPPALLDVMSGQVQFMFDGITTSAPNVMSGRLKALAVTSPQRSLLLPGVPTLAELGDVNLTQTIAMTLFATPGMPATVTAQLRQQALDALRSPELLATFSAAGLRAGAPQQTTDGLRRSMRGEYQRTGEILRSIKYKPVS
jgi:tripartite-type tricarboxylate transporter receptor subunit TctC